MVVPLAACKGGPCGPDCLSIAEAGVTETWAPVSTRKHLFEMPSVTKSWVSLEESCADAAAQHGGSEAGGVIADPLWRFPAWSS